MIDNAIAGNPIETDFDETKMSALETKLSRYLVISETNKIQIAEEKARINELISDISHQTKTPITNILLYSQLLEESEMSQKDSSCVHALTAQVEKLNFLISSLVKISRLENGIIVLSPKIQSVQPLLLEIMEQCEAKAVQKNIVLTCSDSELEANFDLKWTVEAILNIVDNAIKYTPVDGKISISIVAYQLFLKIDICDNGTGISEEEIPKIFLRFYRSVNASEIQGVGIGLYLARKIISDEGGYIKVSSKIGNGSTFSVFLPISK